MEVFEAVNKVGVLGNPSYTFTVVSVPISHEHNSYGSTVNFKYNLIIFLGHSLTFLIQSGDPESR